MDQEKETSLREDIINSMAEVKEASPEVKSEEIEQVEKPAKDRDESGKFKAKEEAIETPVEAIKTVEPPPQSLSGAIKAKWSELPEDVRQEWSKREEDVHKMMTRNDGELNLGRQMKDVVSPYMAQIQAEGGTPVTVVKDLLNTAYLLRTGTPQQKAQMVQQIIQAYNVDIGQAPEQQSIDPSIADLRQKIADLEQRANPDVIKKQLQEEAEGVKINEEVKAFALDPANVHYEKVKGQMAALLGNGYAADLKEAYESAIWADPSIRSTLMTQQAKPVDMQAKKAAASSITGSPGSTVPNTGAPNRSLREEIAANVRAAMTS